MGEDYIRTARAKGLPTFRIVAVHALRNAMIPVITVIGLQVGVLLTGGSSAHLLGTDAIGRDILSRLIQVRGCP